jgi:S1-C subfamily serine protease
MVQVIVETAADGGKLARPWFGANGDTITAEIAEGLGLDRPRGVLLSDVTEDSPAGRAGLQPGDIVLSIGGFDINDIQSLKYRLATVGTGKTVRVEYLRKSKPATAELELVGQPDEPRDITKIEGRNPLSGATVGNLSPAFAEELRIDQTEGVVVLSTERGSPAARVRVRPGDVVMSVNGEQIDDVDELKEAVTNERSGWRISLKRGGDVFTLNFGR